MIKNYLQEFSLKNKNIMILGASGVIGEKVAEAIISAKGNVCLIDKNSDLKKKIKKNLKNLMSIMQT